MDRRVEAVVVRVQADREEAEGAKVVVAEMAEAKAAEAKVADMEEVPEEEEVVTVEEG